MADNYLRFSAIIDELTEQETAWLKEQLTVVYGFGKKEYTEDDMPANLRDKTPDWSCPRFLFDNPDYDRKWDALDFEYSFDSDNKSLLLYADEYGNIEHVAWLVQKFLRQFRPDERWFLTYAATCSKPRVGEFSGGAVFVTADAIQYYNAYDFVHEQQTKFEERRRSATDTEKDKNEQTESGAPHTTTIAFNVEYDPQQTDPESLAYAMDKLLETALSTPDILDEYGNPSVGECFVISPSDE